MAEILFNSKRGEYTLKEKIKDTKSEKRVPIKFKLEDKTSKYRKEILKKEILSK